MENFCYSRSINLSEEGKSLSAVTSFEAATSVFNIADGRKSFSITTTSRSIPEGSEEVVDKMNELLALRSQIDIELHVKRSLKRVFRKEIENNGYNLEGFDPFKSELLSELRRCRI